MIPTRLYASITEYPDAGDPTKKTTTSYSYTFHAGTCQVQETVTTLPAVATSQNGSGLADTRRDVFDTYGHRTWRMDERGFIRYDQFDIPTGGQVKQIGDVDTSQMTGVPSGWETPTGGGLHLVTDFQFDDLGRMTRSLGPIHSIDLAGVATSIRHARWIVYQDASHQIWTAQGYATGAQYDTFTLVNPVRITMMDKAGNVTEEVQATRASTSGALSSSDSFPQSTYTRWATTQYTECCLAASQRVYRTIPGSGEGSSGTNYNETVFGHDAMKRRNRRATPGGTINRIVFDAQGNPWKMYTSKRRTTTIWTGP